MSPGCASGRHTAHVTANLELHYPWHPLQGRELTVNFISLRGVRTARCRIPGTIGRSFDLPPWMFDSSRCRRMCLVDVPAVSWESLMELGQLLDDAAEVKHGRGTVEERHGSPDKEGGVQADADKNEETEQRAVGVVPATAEPPVVERTARKREKQGARPTGSRTDRARSRKRNGRERRGGQR